MNHACANLSLFLEFFLFHETRHTGKAGSWTHSLDTWTLDTWTMDAWALELWMPGLWTLKF